MLYKYRTWLLFFLPTSWLNQSVHWRSVRHMQTNTISHSQQWSGCHVQLRSIKTVSRAVFSWYLLRLKLLTCSSWHFPLMTYLHPPCWLSRPHFSPLRASLSYIMYLQVSLQRAICSHLSRGAEGLCHRHCCQAWPLWQGAARLLIRVFITTARSRDKRACTTRLSLKYELII